MTDEELGTILENWRAYNLRPDARLGYPPRAVPFASGGVVSVENRDGLTHSEEYEAVDEREAKIVEVVINDLPAPERDAVYNTVMGTRRPLGESLIVVYTRARPMLIAGLIRKGLA